MNVYELKLLFSNKNWLKSAHLLLEMPPFLFSYSPITLSTLSVSLCIVLPFRSCHVELIIPIYSQSQELSMNQQLALLGLVKA